MVTGLDTIVSRAGEEDWPGNEDIDGSIIMTQPNSGQHSINVCD